MHRLPLDMRASLGRCLLNRTVNARTFRLLLIVPSGFEESSDLIDQTFVDADVVRPASERLTGCIEQSPGSERLAVLHQ